MGSSAMAPMTLLNHRMTSIGGHFYKILIAMLLLYWKERCIVDVESEETRIVAEALTRAKQVSKADDEITTDANQERLERMSRAAEMEDLQAPQNFPLAPLSIKDPRDYFESQQ
ncbi:unnamed protein product [Arabidopsis halleri]